MKQVSLVSLYGHKPKPLADLLRGCIDIIRSSSLRWVFRPYHPNQIHGTIVGMEKRVGYADHFNANQWIASERNIAMIFTPLISTLQRHLPMTIQFGGFPPAFNAFASFDRRPYERSFQVQWSTNRFTIIGWPREHGNFTSRPLNRLRDDLDANCNLAHRYPDDNDLFMVLGEIAGAEHLSDSELGLLKHDAQHIETKVRDYLSNCKIDVTIDVNDVFLAQYKVETLALDTTAPYRITHPLVNPTFIANLYHP